MRTFIALDDRMVGSSRSILARLEEIRERFDRHSERDKSALLDLLADAEFDTPARLHRYHELACFMRAYPDGPEVLERATRILDHFDERADLKKLSRDLVNSGIAGTRIDYEFYWVTATWLARHWPAYLRMRWNIPASARARLDALLKSLLPYAELILLDEGGFGIRDWIELAKGPDETDATFLVRRFEKLRSRHFTRELLYEDLELPMSLLPGPDTPSRTKVRYAAAPIAWQKKPRSHERPVLRRDMRKKPRKVTRVSRSEGRKLVKLARQSMVTREREVEAFANASQDDVMVIDWEHGLQLIGMGPVPERRHILECVYIFLIVQNGVPIGYVQPCALFGSAEVNFNVFETFRGADAGRLYGRALATIRYLMGVDCIVLDPYQVGGGGNAEAIESGAWWFYYKMGFRPRDPEVRSLAFSEARKVKANPRYRTPASVLRQLGEAEMYYFLNKKRDDVLHVFPLENLGLHVTLMLASRFGADREKSIATCAREAASLLGLRSLRTLSKAERRAWERWSPLLLTLPGVERWKRDEKRAAASVITAKGGRSELDYLHQLNRHSRLKKALHDLARTPVDA